MFDLKQRSKCVCSTFIAVIYFAVLIYIIMFKNGSAAVRDVRLIPFGWAARYLSGEMTFANMLKNVLGNIFLFVPVGIVLPLLTNEGITLKKSVAAGFLLSLCAEAAQYVFSKGVSDADDIIINTIGAFIGAGIYYFIFKKLNVRKNVIIIFLLVFGAVGFTCVWFYQPDLIIGKIPYYGESIAGVDMESYDISAVCYHISYGGVFIKPGTVNKNNLGYGGEIKDTYYFTDDTVFVIHKGDAYRAVNREDFKKRMDEVKNAPVCIWFDNSENCKMILYNEL